MISFQVASWVSAILSSVGSSGVWGGGELLVPAQLDDPDSFPLETDVGSVEARCQEVPASQCHQQPGAASIRLRLHGESSSP